MAKKKNEAERMAELSRKRTWPILAVLCCGFLGAMGQLFLKFGSDRITSGLTGILSVQILVGLALYGLSTVIFLMALRHEDISVLYPIIATSYVWVSILSIRYLGEKMTLAKWGGNLLIVIGVGLIGFSIRKDRVGT